VSDPAIVATVMDSDLRMQGRWSQSSSLRMFADALWEDAFFFDIDGVTAKSIEMRPPSTQPWEGVSQDSRI
jgi:hypothetical protein